MADSQSLFLALWTLYSTRETKQLHSMWLFCFVVSGVLRATLLGWSQRVSAIDDILAEKEAAGQQCAGRTQALWSESMKPLTVKWKKENHRAS